MNDKLVFDHSKKFNEETVAVPWKDFKIDNTFYAVDRVMLDEMLPRAQRVASAFLSDGPMSDRAIMRTVVKFASVNSKHIARKPVAVKLVEDEGTNYATLTGTSIAISLSPFFDHRIELQTRFNVVAAVIYHELFHCRYTTPELGTILQKRGFTNLSLNRNGKKTITPDYSKIEKILPTSLFKDISNILEDRRIEAIGLQEFPGYVFFFDDHRRYAAWRRKNKMATKKIAGPIVDPLQQDNILLDYLLYKVLLPEMLDDFITATEVDTTGLTENKFRQIDEIVDNKVNTFSDILMQTDKLYALFSKEFKEHHTTLSYLPQLDLPKELLEALEKLMQEVAHELKAEGICDEEVKSLPKNPKGVARPYSEVEYLSAEQGNFDSVIYDEAYRISRTIQSNLAFLDSRFNRTTEVYELQHGDLDEGSIHLLKFKNRDLFYDETTMPGYSLDVAILVDESGSMGSGHKIRDAKIATLAMALAMQNNKHMNLFVYGHTADQYRSEVTMYRYLDPLEGAHNMNSLFSVQSRSNNADGYAIEQMGLILKKGRSRQKVLIVVSDGQPAAHCYGGSWGRTDEGIQHTANVVKQLEKENVFVIQIAVENLEHSAEMFTHFVPYDGQQLGKHLRQILNKKLVQISNLV